MELIDTLEAHSAQWYGKLPHLPQAWRTWLAVNSWWLVLVYVVIVGLGLLALLQVALLGGLVLGVTFGMFGALVGGLLVLAMSAWLGLSVLTIVLMVLAIRPLRSRQKRGWTLLFVVLLVSLLVTVVRALSDGHVMELVSGLLSALLSGYLLFEIRDYFGATTPAQPDHRRVDDSPEFKAPTDKHA